MADSKGSIRRRLFFTRKSKLPKKESVELSPEMKELEQATNGLLELEMSVTPPVVTPYDSKKTDSKSSKKSSKSSKKTPDVYKMVTQWNHANGHSVGDSRKGSFSEKKMDPTRTWTSSARRQESDDVMDVSPTPSYPKGSWSASTFRKTSEPSPSPSGSWSSSTVRKVSNSLPNPTASWSGKTIRNISAPVLVHSTVNLPSGMLPTTRESNSNVEVPYTTGSNMEVPYTTGSNVEVPYTTGSNVEMPHTTGSKVEVPYTTGSWNASTLRKQTEPNGYPLMKQSESSAGWPADFQNESTLWNQNEPSVAYSAGTWNSGTLKKNGQSEVAYPTGSWSASTLRKQSELNAANPTGTWSSSTLKKSAGPNTGYSAGTGSSMRGSAPSSSIHSTVSNSALLQNSTFTRGQPSDFNDSGGHNLASVDGSSTWSIRSSASMKHSWARPERKVSDLDVSNLDSDRRVDYNPFRGLFTPPEMSVKETDIITASVALNNNNIEKAYESLELLNNECSMLNRNHDDSLRNLNKSTCSLEVDEVLGEIENYLGTLQRKSMKAKQSAETVAKKSALVRKDSKFDNVENKDRDNKDKHDEVDSGQHHSPPSPATVHQLKHQLSLDSQFSRSQSSPAPSVYTDGAEYIHHTPKFVKDTSKFWYKANITREEAILMLKDKHPGTFVIRDSNSFPGAFGLALKVSQLPPNVQSKAADPSTELVRHFLIESTSKGVRLKGCSNEPIFGSLAALVYQHSITPLALPCKLVLPELGGSENGAKSELPSSAAALLAQGAACNVLFIGSVEMESLTGPQAISRAMTEMQKLDPKTTEVHFKVSSQGVTLTDNQRKLFFRRHYAVNTVTYCGMDPEDRRWVSKDDSGKETLAKVFGFVAKKQGSQSDNLCHIFAELDPDQPASAIVNFVTKVMIGSKSNVSQS